MDKTGKVKLHRHISFAEFLEGKGEAEIITIVPPESSINNSSSKATLQAEVKSSSAAEYWEELVESAQEKEVDRDSRNRNLLEASALRIKDYKLGLMGGEDTIDYTMKIVASDGNADYEILIEGKEENYVSEGMLKRDVEIMVEEGENIFRNRLMNLFGDELPSNYFE